MVKDVSCQNLFLAFLGDLCAIYELGQNFNKINIVSKLDSEVRKL